MKYAIITFVLLFIFPSIHSVRAQESSPASLQVDSIVVIGNTKTRLPVILDYLDFREGDEITAAHLQRSLQRLENTNFFKEVNIYTQPGSQKGHVRVYVEVKERHWPFFQFKSGYNELDGWYISPLGLRFDNLLGRGNYFGAEFLIGDRVIGMDIAYMRPRIFQSNLNFRLLVFSRTRDFVHYLNDAKYLQKVYQGGLGLRLNSNEGLLKYIWFEYVSSTYHTDDFITPADHPDQKEPLPEMFVPYVEEKRIGRFIISLYADTRDQRIYPTSGWWGSLSLDQVSTEFGAFTDFKKIILDVRRYQKLMGRTVLALRLKAARVDSAAPFYERFYLGGPNSLRGYRDRSLNPLGFATHLIQASAEIRFPITRSHFPGHFLTGVLFYDVGQAWNEPDRFAREEMHAGLGYGFRIKLPLIGLLRLDFAYAVPTYDFRLHVSLGHTF